jgi:hypothetical protein
LSEAFPWLRAAMENAHDMLGKVEMGETSSIIVR